MTAPLPLRIDKSSPIPLYHQLALGLETAIRNGSLTPGTKLESEIKLATRLRIARTTVRHALKYLVDAGLVVRTQHVGTYVTPPTQWTRAQPSSTLP